MEAFLMKSPIAVIAASVLAFAALAACDTSGHHAVGHRHAAEHHSIGLAAPALTCGSVGGWIETLVRDYRAQTKLFKEISGHLSESSADDIAAGAWTDPGIYSNDLDTFISTEGNVKATQPSTPSILAQDIASAVKYGQALQGDMQSGGTSTGQPVVQDLSSFQTDIASLASECGMTAPNPWA